MPTHHMDRETHACYPHDFGIPNHVRDLSVYEAADLLGIPRDDIDPDGLFINKGFIVLGLPLPRDYDADFRAQVRGKQAVYNHDGHYRLIEWKP